MSMSRISDIALEPVVDAADERAESLPTEQFELELREHLRTLSARALQLTHQREAADDLVQDTIERAYRKRSLFRPGTDLRAWLLCIMRNVWINGHRRRLQEPNTIQLDAVDEVALHPRAVAHAPGESIVERLVADDLGEAEILDALSSLSPGYRDVVVLAVVEGEPCKVVAEALSIPLGSVCSRLSRAREQLRRTLLAQDHHVGGLDCAR